MNGRRFAIFLLAAAAALALTALAIVPGLRSARSGDGDDAVSVFATAAPAATPTPAPTPTPEPAVTPPAASAAPASGPDIILETAAPCSDSDLASAG